MMTLDQNLFVELVLYNIHAYHLCLHRKDRKDRKDPIPYREKRGLSCLSCRLAPPNYHGQETTRLTRQDRAR